jgi:release factor glutamine methyltransferase
MKATGLSEAALWTAIDSDVAPAAAARFLALVERRRKRFPLAYLTGEKEFWSLSFLVGPGVLIPRPETELLVETALRLAPPGPATIVEIGSGSGCVAIALARELPAARIYAVERSRRALRASRLNAERHAITQVDWLEGSFFAPLSDILPAGRADLVLSNPPYIPQSEWARLAPEVRDHEPKRALAAGRDGLGFIRSLIPGAAVLLRSGGALAFEIGAGQSRRVVPLFGEEWDPPRLERDLAGIPRVVTARRRG